MWNDREHLNAQILQDAKITDFLNEVEEQEWELDRDDIIHLLRLDFDYVRKQYE